MYDEPVFWMTPDEADKPENKKALGESRRAVGSHQVLVAGVPGAYWCRMSHESVRYVRPEPRDAVLDALGPHADR